MPRGGFQNGVPRPDPHRLSRRTTLEAASSPAQVPVWGLVAEYERHDPEQTLLHEVVREQLEGFLASASHRDQPVPRFIEQELRAFLRCGVLAHGFLRLHCDDCGHDRLVAFSCKRRGFCPSCGGRRMADVAAHLVDFVLPEVPIRQWVLTLPYPLRYRCAYDSRLPGEVLRALIRALFAELRRRARRQWGVRGEQCCAHLKYLAAGSYGTEYISKYVREHAFSTLEDAHWRLSALPASCAGFENRGVLKEGAAADIIVYDYENLDYEFPTFRHDLPGDEYRIASAGSGYKYVLVNGAITIVDDEQTDVYSGKLLRKGA